MACPHCGSPDDTDRSAEAHGLVLKSVAARTSGRSRTWIESRIAGGELQTAQFAGRTYVVGCSLVKLLTVTDMRSDAIELDRLLETNEPMKAQELHKRLYPHVWASVGSTPSQSTAVSRDSGDAAADFVRRFGGNR
jgi:hypothetical protein